VSMHEDDVWNLELANQKEHHSVCMLKQCLTPPYPVLSPLHPSFPSTVPLSLPSPPFPLFPPLPSPADSSRPTHSQSFSRSRGYTYNYGGNVDSPYLSTNIQKLFSERIKVFGEVQFTKLSVVTGVIKIALKVVQGNLSIKGTSLLRTLSAAPITYSCVRIYL